MKELGIDVVLVMGHDRLFQQLLKTCSSDLVDNKVTVVKLPRSGGVVNRDPGVRSLQRSRRIKHYFYSSTLPQDTQPSGAVEGEKGKDNTIPPPLPLSPCPIDLKLSQVKLWAFVGGGRTSSVELDGLLPVTGESTIDPCALERIEPTTALLHTLMAVYHAPEEDSEEDELKFVQEGTIAGFVVVQEISVDRQSMTVLAPCPGRLPSVHLVSGGVKWME
uniref:Uncharacterized protein n=2 Tax=Octactis speculum TaxID=3111310 RepID=A0A7S2G541_9STRA|mmetsp:Transcript_38342/g.51946  ORF Transcript_38342/g.51946 Transcript_38342/m.51946 type:complete len:219 (+) Transcript_38342:148-804(+)